ncbi:MAG: Ldh family oxidoreductase [Candidatus Dormibacteraceae bacterium]
MSTRQRTIHPERLTAFVLGVLQQIGTPEDIAGEVARHLVGANLAGHDSHGVLRLSWYLGAAERGELDVAARPEVVLDRKACALVDAHRGFGHYATKVALDWAMDRAPDFGLASVAMRRSGHIGRLGEYTERATARGFLAIVTVGNAGPASRWTPPFGGGTPFLGTNPWSLGAPAGPVPYVFDGATTMVAEGKVRAARARGAEMPPGCITDKDGRPTTSPDEFYEGGFMMPLGGNVAGHKGYGLGLGAALFGALSLAANPAEAPSDGSVDGVWLLVIDPAAFGDAGGYRSLTERNLAALMAVPPAAGVTEVLVPGEPEERSRRRRSAGIPLPEATWDDLSRVADRFGVALEGPGSDQ